MYTFILMLKDLIDNSNLHWFFVFFVFILIRWAIVFFNSLRYKNYKYHGKKKFFTSVIIPVVDEPIDVFSNVLLRIAKQRPNEMIIVINGPKNKKLENVCARLKKACGHISELKGLEVKTIYTPTPGKRNAIRLGIEAANKCSEISVLVDSDTVWTKNTLSELLKPFAVDNKIGGVTTRQKIFKPNRNIVTMFANLLEEIRAEGSMKAMSSTGKVGCLPGRTIAFRTNILRKVMNEFMTEKFMGIHKEVSDDRSLTNLTLKLGYKTVMQDTSVVYTDAPLTWRKFIRQQLRWAEGSQYNNLRMTGWMFKNSKLMFFIYWTDMIMPMLLISVYANILICFICNHFLSMNVATIAYPSAIWLTAILIVAGSILSFGCRNIKVLLHMPFYYVLLLPVFIVILTIIMVPVRIVGFMRCADELGWGTRNIGQEQQKKTHKGWFYAGITFALLVCCAIYGISKTSSRETAITEIPPVAIAKVDKEFDSGKNIGIYLNEPKDIKAMGDNFDIVAWFDTWPNSVSLGKLDLACEEDSFTPLITWQPRNISLNDIALGKYDEYITSYLSSINSACSEKTVLLRFGHEMEMRPNYKTPWYSWQGHPVDYKNAWMRIVSLGRTIAPDVKYVWSPNRADGYERGYYPGADYVDYVSLSLNRSPSQSPQYRDFESFYIGAGRDNLESYGKK